MAEAQYDLKKLACCVITQAILDDTKESRAWLLTKGTTLVYWCMLLGVDVDYLRVGISTAMDDEELKSKMIKGLKKLIKDNK